MAEKVEHIGKKEIAWSYAGTFFTIGAGVILLPFMLNKLPSETIGIWTVFQTISMLVFMMDMGFKPSFSRNLSYIFSGVKALQREGITQEPDTAEVDYSLLNGTLKAMKQLYSWFALAALVLLGTIGTVYFIFLLKKYSGDHADAIIAWILVVLINCYNIYTLYYEALLTGKGYIKESQQINILGQLCYLVLSIVLIYCGFGLTAIVGSQAVSVVIRRILSYRVFYNPELKSRLANAGTQDSIPILKAIYPNAIKSGLTSIGGFLVNKSSVFICSLFLPLPVTASLGITIQVMEILNRCGVVVYTSTLPKIAQFRVERNIPELKRLYLYSVLALVLVFIGGSTALILLGNPILELLHSETLLLPSAMLCTMSLIYFLEENHIIATGYIMADNRIPFFIPSLLSGVGTVVLMLLFMRVFDWGLWGAILAPGVAQLVYQNWKWPSVVIKEFWGK